MKEVWGGSEGLEAKCLFDFFGVASLRCLVCPQIDGYRTDTIIDGSMYYLLVCVMRCQ